MANGLEIRPPLDDRIINFSKTLDSKESVGLKDKDILRDYMYENNILILTNQSTVLHFQLENGTNSMVKIDY